MNHLLRAQIRPGLMFELYPEPGEPSRPPTWDDVERLSLHYPILHRAVMLVNMGYLTRDQALVVAVFGLATWSRELVKAEIDRRAGESEGGGLRRLIYDVAAELERAEAKHAPMRGAHEGYAVILEELDELWAEVKRQPIDPTRMRKEALQVATMAVRFIKDVCDARAK